MQYKIVELTNFRGKEAKIYTVYIENLSKTLFEVFIYENINLHLSEIKDLINRLKVISDETGARESYFKHKEGKPGDLVCALYDRPKSKLRLYCIRFGTLILIIGGGGLKPKNIRALQDDPKLKSENELMTKISEDIYKRIQERDIEISKDGKELLGNLEFGYDET